MKGFFQLTSEPATKGAKKGRAPRQPLRFDCDTCGLYKTGIHSPKMDPFGRGRLGILNIGEGPGEVEDRKGRPWQGPVGQLLEIAYQELGISLFGDCWNMNSVACRPTEKAKTKDLKNRSPEPLEISCCRKVKVEPAIEDYKPNVIILLGHPALSSVVGPRGPEDLGPIGKWRGWTIPDRSLNAWLCPTFHPSYVARSMPSTNPRDRNRGLNAAVELVWKRDLARAFALRDTEVPQFRPEEELVEVLYQEDDIEANLGNILREFPETFFDIETTGLKPHNRDVHRIVSWSFSIGRKAIAFLHPEGKRCRDAIKRLLTSRRVGKGAHGMKFEHNWVRECEGYEVQNWVWDPMDAAHVRDNRTGTCGLDFQAYVHFGRARWGETVRPYLETDTKKKGANIPNRILELIKTKEGRRDLLLYNGIDVIITKRLADVQRADKSLNRDSYQLIHDGILALADAECAGIRMDEKAAKRSVEILDQKIEHLEQRSKDSDIFRAIEKRYGAKANLDSKDQLSTVLYKDMGIEPPRINEKSQKGSVDEEALMGIGDSVPGLGTIIRCRKLQKIRDTYLDGFIREAFGGYLHPSFHLHVARSYRSSCSNPNLQNVPIREEEAMRITRGVLFPRPGRQLLEFDYQGVEVRVSECYHKDPVMKKYILDPTSDMHADTARQLFKLETLNHKANRSHKHLRYCAKNQFVFPQFYGDYYGNNADALCRSNGLPRDVHRPWPQGVGPQLTEGGEYLSDHLIKEGIECYADFEKHVQEIERDFWRRRFRVYAEWKEQWWEDYQRKGYVELLSGFRCVDVMSKNESINRPIQGSAFHCTLWLFIQLNREQKERGWDSRLIGQVHDSIIVDANPEEAEEVYEVTTDLIARLPKLWPWIIVPLDFEAEAAGVDEPWSMKQSWTP